MQMPCPIAYLFILQQATKESITRGYFLHLLQAPESRAKHADIYFIALTQTMLMALCLVTRHACSAAAAPSWVIGRA